MGRTARVCLAKGCSTTPYKGRSFCSEHIWMQAFRDNKETMQDRLVSRFGRSTYKHLTTVRSFTSVGAASVYSDLKNQGLPARFAAQVADSAKAMFNGSIPEEPLTIRQARQIRSPHVATRDAMVKSGVKKRDIVAAVLRGSSVTTPDDDVISNGGRIHVVAGIRDPRSKTIVLMDPSLAKFSPVPPGRDDVLAEDVYSRSKFGTPFDDSPWIGTPSEIREGGGYLSWSDVRICDGDDRSIRATIDHAKRDYEALLDSERGEEDPYAPPARDPEPAARASETAPEASDESQSALDEILGEEVNRRKAERAQRTGRI